MHIVQPHRREGKPGEKEEQGKESRVTDSQHSRQHTGRFVVSTHVEEERGTPIVFLNF